MILNFGKYRGMELSQIPTDYVEWLRDARRKDLQEFEAELERRALAETAALSVVERIVQAGYRTLAKNAHPDAGGTDTEFRALQAAKAQLEMILGELKSNGSQG